MTRRRRIASLLLTIGLGVGAAVLGTTPAFAATNSNWSGWVATGGDASAYHYLLSGVRDFPGAPQFAEEIREPHAFDAGLSKSQAARRIERLQERLRLGELPPHTD